MDTDLTGGVGDLAHLLWFATAPVPDDKLPFHIEEVLEKGPPADVRDLAHSSTNALAFATSWTDSDPTVVNSHQGGRWLPVLAKPVQGEHYLGIWFPEPRSFRTFALKVSRRDANHLTPAFRARVVVQYTSCPQPSTQLPHSAWATVGEVEIRCRDGKPRSVWRAFSTSRPVRASAVRFVLRTHSMALEQVQICEQSFMKRDTYPTRHLGAQYQVPRLDTAMLQSVFRPASAPLSTRTVATDVLLRIAKLAEPFAPSVKASEGSSLVHEGVVNELAMPPGHSLLRCVPPRVLSASVNVCGFCCMAVCVCVCVCGCVWLCVWLCVC